MFLRSSIRWEPSKSHCPLSWLFTRKSFKTSPVFGVDRTFVVSWLAFGSCATFKTLPLIIVDSWFLSVSCLRVSIVGGFGWVDFLDEQLQVVFQELHGFKKLFWAVIKSFYKNPTHSRPAHFKTLQFFHRQLPHLIPMGCVPSTPTQHRTKTIRL